jgi:hypothetical protein
MDCEASSSRARRHLRQLVRMRWLAIGIVAALVYSTHSALDIHVPLATHGASALSSPNASCSCSSSSTSQR